MITQAKNQKGQTFIEFIFLFVILIALSFLLIKGINSGVAKKWKTYVEKIAAPTTDTIQFR